MLRDHPVYDRSAYTETSPFSIHILMGSANQPVLREFVKCAEQLYILARHPLTPQVWSPLRPHRPLHCSSQSQNVPFPPRKSHNLHSHRQSPKRPPPPAPSCRKVQPRGNNHVCRIAQTRDLPSKISACVTAGP